jgi:hypothetical protein
MSIFMNKYKKVLNFLFENKQSKQSAIINELNRSLSFHINLCNQYMKDMVLKPAFSIDDSNDPARHRVLDIEFEPEDYQVGIEKTKENQSTFCVWRYCILCLRTDWMYIDYEHGLVDKNGAAIPNLREKISCQHCHMNNRQRLIAKLAHDLISKNNFEDIYLHERITPIYDYISKLFQNKNIVGSEYFSEMHQSGDIVDGKMHQDIMRTSFDDNSFDLIISNDVYEHVPEPLKAFKEALRILKSNGVLMATIPFNESIQNSVQRSKVEGKSIVHLLPQVYHGNPVSADGALVYFDYGWDILDLIKSAGFSSVNINYYQEDMLGHFGKAIAIIVAIK